MKEGNYLNQTQLFGLSDKVIKGAFYTGCAMLWDVQGTKPFKMELAHKHDFAEVIVLTGTQKDKPRDLGGEIEFWLEDEEYIITKSTLIYVPGGLSHCPLFIKRIDHPIGFFTAGIGGEYTRDWEEADT
jgi:hypothetical protein